MRYTITQKGKDLVEYVSNPDNHKFTPEGELIWPTDVMCHQADHLLRLTFYFGDTFDYEPLAEEFAGVSPLAVRVLERLKYIEHTGKEIFEEQVEAQERLEKFRSRLRGRLPFREE